MDQELQDLSITLVDIYQKNLNLLKNSFEEVYTQTNDLSLKIESGEYLEKYSLKYIDGYFDILNLENNGLFYNSNSYEDADNRASHTNFTKDASLNLLRKHPLSNQLVADSTYHDVIPVVNYINTHVDLDNIEFQRIYKFIYIGVGLGFHIHEINNKLTPMTTLIIEPNLEIFRLSLFVIDYSNFEKGNQKLFLSIGDNQKKRKMELANFYQYHNYMNNTIKHHLLLDSYDYIKDEIVSFFASHSATHFSYKLILQNLFRTVHFLKDEKPFLDFDLIREKKILQDKKVLIISAGPSLDNYVTWIKEHQDKFFIICVDVIVRKLEKNGIVPDIIVSIDPSDLCADYVTTKDPDYLNNSVFILLSQQGKKIMEVIKDKKYYFSQVLYLVKELGFLGSSENVGNFSFEIAIHLGATELYLIGCDAAFNQETGAEYAGDILPKMNPLNEQIDKDTITFNDVIEVDGNFRDKVTTNRNLLKFKESYDRSIHNFESIYEYTAYNLSDGVHIDGFTPLSYEEISQKIETFKINDINIHNELSSISRVIQDLDYEHDIKILTSIITRTKKFQKLKLLSKDDFLEKKLDFMIWILTQCKKMSVDIFANIFLKYTELIDIYINFLLNLKQQNLYSKVALKEISLMWSTGLISLIKDIKKAIK